jgi:DNA repair protein RecO (recombination protein O)
MSATKTHAFVLKTQDYRDTSLLASFYTKEHGKIRGIIRGIRDTRARFGSMLEPFSLNEILFYKRKRGGDLHQVTQVDLIDLFAPLREDLERVAFASYFAELLDELVEVEDPNLEIFDLLQSSLTFLSADVSPRRAARIFETKLLDFLGLMPETGVCVVCKSENPDPVFFSVVLGGIHCKNCENKPGLAKGVSMPVSRGVLNFIEHVKTADFRNLYHVKVSQEVGEILEKILRRFVDFHLHHKLKSVIFLEKMGWG